MKGIWLAFLILFGVAVGAVGIVDGVASYMNAWVDAEACRRFAVVTAGIACFYATTVNLTLIGWLCGGQFKK